MRIFVIVPEDHELDLDVTIRAGRPATFLDPEEPAEVEVNRAWLCRGWDAANHYHRQKREIDIDPIVERVKSLDDNIREAAFEKAADLDAYYREEAADRRRERELERRRGL